MRLRQYLDERQLTPVEFGKRIGRKRLAVYRYMLPPENPQSRLPGRATMLAIFVATAGAVRPDDFYELPDLESAPAVNGAALDGAMA